MLIRTKRHHIQTSIQYNPIIIINRITVVSYIFYGGYAGMLLLPLLLQIAGEKRFSKYTLEKP